MLAALSGLVWAGCCPWLRSYAAESKFLWDSGLQRGVGDVQVRADDGHPEVFVVLAALLPNLALLPLSRAELEVIRTLGAVSRGALRPREA